MTDASITLDLTADEAITVRNALASVVEELGSGRWANTYDSDPVATAAQRLQDVLNRLDRACTPILLAREQGRL